MSAARPCPVPDVSKWPVGESANVARSTANDEWAIRFPLFAPRAQLDRWSAWERDNPIIRGRKMAEDIEKRIEQYVEIRDRLRDLDARHEEERKPFTDTLAALDGKIQKFMQDNNITQSLKTKAGTCYLSVRYTASVADAEMFMNFVKQGNWDMIERRANATAVKDYVKENNQLPPGCNLNAVQSLGVRRASGKTGE